MFKSLNLILGSLFCISLSLTLPITLVAQKSYFNKVDVEEFTQPYEEIVVSVYGTSQSVKVTPSTKYLGAKRRKIKPSLIEEGATISKLSYELIGENYVATIIETDISADGSINISGLYEGTLDGKAYVDGYPVVLGPNVQIVGENAILKKKKCACAGLVIPKFKHPLLPPGQFYVEVFGSRDESGLITANKVKICRNTFAKPERDLLAATNQNFVDNTTRISQVPNNIYVPKMGLYNGQIQVGQYSYPLTDNIQLQGYINQVGNRLLPEHAVESQDYHQEVSYRFYVIDDPVPNAFAFPNGMIFIHTGLLEIIENEAQLAIVLGHEIAHVTHEHGRERYENVQITEVGMNLYQSFFSKSLQTQFYQMAPNLSPTMLNTLTEVSANITPAAISNIMKPQTKMESQADRVGLYYAYQAGYDIREAANFWNNMQELTGNNSFQTKIISQMISSLQSDRLQYMTYGQNPLQKLGAAGTEVLAKQLIDTIYTSHPKAQKRARATAKLVSTVYADTEWEDTRINADKYLDKVRP